MRSQVLWRTGPILLTNTSCRHCISQCISSICSAYFSDVTGFAGFRKLWIRLSADHQTEHQILFFFGVILVLGSALELLLSPIRAGHRRLSYKIHFSMHITIQSKNSSLLCRIRKDNTSKQQFFLFSISSWGNYLPNYFNFPISFKWWISTKWSTLSSAATSRVVVRVSASMIALNSSLSLSDGQPPHFSSQGYGLLCKTS